MNNIVSCCSDRKIIKKEEKNAATQSINFLARYHDIYVLSFMFPSFFLPSLVAVFISLPNESRRIKQSNKWMIWFVVGWFT
jgi:hypothetical protein